MNINHYRLKLSYILTALLLVVIASCKPTEFSTPEIFENDVFTSLKGQAGGEADLFVKALERTGLDQVLVDRNRSFTVFAPTNQAIVRFLDDAGFASIEEVPVDVLRPIIQYHIVTESLRAADFTNNDFPTLLEGAKLPLGYTCANTGLVSARFETSAQLATANGFIHRVGAVQVPIELEFQAVIDADAQLSTFREALTLTGLNEVLNSGTYTVFAPVNAAFTGAGVNLADFDTPAEIAELRQILLYHVLPGRVTEASLCNVREFTTAEGTIIQSSNLTAVAGVSSYTMNGFGYIAPNTQTTTKTVQIHKMDEVLFPPTLTNSELIAEINAEVDEFLRLKQALDILGINPNDLNSTTILAPIDAAFDDLLAALGVDDLAEVNTDLLATVIRYHVIQGRRFDLEAFFNIAPFVSISGVTINYRNVVDPVLIVTDIHTKNSVVHVLDEVLLPPSVTLPSAVRKRKENTLNNSEVFKKYSKSKRLK